MVVTIANAILEPLSRAVKTKGSKAKKPETIDEESDES
jgi:hypothetical protein